jgi:hypothetical protein
MSNHSIDCKFCGADQRTYGLRCCADAIEHQRAEREAHARTQNRRRELCYQFGIRWKEVGRDVVPDPESFDAFLEELIARMPAQAATP